MSNDGALVKQGNEAPVAVLDWKQIEAVRNLLSEAIAKADEARELIGSVVGPQPAKGAQELLLSINHGTGYLRICEGRIDAMFRALEKTLLQQRCQHDRGLRHQGHHAFCKICDLEFVMNRAKNNWEPVWNSGGSI